MAVLKSEKILEIGNYPPPLCGWAMQTKLLVEEIRRRGRVCEVLKVNENRRQKSSEYVDVQNGFDYLLKLARFAAEGYRFHAHVNAESPKGFVLALAALLVARASLRPGALTFHGGLPQTYFPRPRPGLARWAFQCLFRLPGSIVCNSPEIKRAIEDYGVGPGRVFAIQGYSPEYLRFNPAPLTPAMEQFLAEHQPVFFSYLSFRPEYKLEVLRAAMRQFCRQVPRAGFIWLGFPERERKQAVKYAAEWPSEEARSLLLLGNLDHDHFLTLLSRCYAFVRTPACDGVSASVLESLELGVPVVASENGRRPQGVLTYDENDAADLCAKLLFLCDNYAAIKTSTRAPAAANNIQRTADWLSGSLPPALVEEVARVR